jgi:isoleucyl-tRNA synthetase
MIWNMYDFFTMYAEVDKWEYDGKLLIRPNHLDQFTLDQWIVSRTHQLIAEVEKHMDVYDIPNAMKPILPFIEDASNWYVRRSRRRFWKAGDDDDKNNAYCTLHYVLVHLSMVLAPFTPFLAEELYQKLTGGESVHLLDWPTWAC